METIGRGNVVFFRLGRRGVYANYNFLVIIALLDEAFYSPLNKALHVLALSEYCSLKVFSFAGIIGIFILLPVNCSGTELHQIDFEDLYSNSLDVFTISNVNRGSKW
jgi:hypothetical protein